MSIRRLMESLSLAQAVAEKAKAAAEVRRIQLDATTVLEQSRQSLVNDFDARMFREMLVDSSAVAKRRVRAVTRADRQASGDGKWVKVRGRGVGVPWTCYISLNPVVKDLIRHWEREDKPRYRWEARR